MRKKGVVSLFVAFRSAKGDEAANGNTTQKGGDAMRAFHFSVPRPILAGLVLALVLGTAGCIPGGIVWLPDSSGFVYPAGKDLKRLQFYDVAKREHRVLIEDTGARSVYPGVSPDGK